MWSLTKTKTTARLTALGLVAGLAIIGTTSKPSQAEPEDQFIAFNNGAQVMSQTPAQKAKAIKPMTAKEYQRLQRENAKKGNFVQPGMRVSADPKG